LLFYHLMGGKRSTLVYITTNVFPFDADMSEVS
jgi:hypothetical protein